MCKFVATIKALLTRLLFGAHGFIAIWQVTQFKQNQIFWYMSIPIILLIFEGIFTLTIKENQEWKWFCPSVFLYLSSVVPAIWLLELDKLEKRMKARENTFNLTTAADLAELHKLLGVSIHIPEIKLNTETWVTLIEQFLMLILIVGRWMLPKGDLTRDQLSQLLLVYIGTAADIIEFFDSFKDDTIASEPILVMLTLAIWSWSLIQFTIVLTATKSRKSRLSSDSTAVKPTTCCCCNIDVWGILLNIALQDAPFLAFRLIIIVHYRIVSYMNVFFTCKNTLVIVLQLYRLYVVHSETKKTHKALKQKQKFIQMSNLSIISKGNDTNCKHKNKKYRISDRNFDTVVKRYGQDYESKNETFSNKSKKKRNKTGSRKDTTSYTTSSKTSCTQTPPSFLINVTPNHRSNKSVITTISKCTQSRHPLHYDLEMGSEESDNDSQASSYIGSDLNDSNSVSNVRRDVRKSRKVTTSDVSTSE